VIKNIGNLEAMGLDKIIVSGIDPSLLVSSEELITI
jgi:hypothetical protein